MRGPAVQTLRCKNCGADVPISSPGTVLVTCGHCSALCLRRDVELETLGEVALPAPLRSRFRIGTTGLYRGLRFEVRGQVQLDHGAGLWNEWAAEGENGWMWIAEAQGELHVYEEVGGLDPPPRSALPDVDPGTGAFVPPLGDQLRAGRRVKLGDGRSWTVRELGRGTVVTFRGELPVRMEAGARTTYVDLCRGAHEVATLDYTRAGGAEVLTGRLATPADFQLDPDTLPDDGPEALASATVTCGHCGGTVEVTDAEKALSLGCVHCGSVLQRATHLEAYHVAEVAERLRSEPTIPLGSVGRLRGEELTVIGYLRRGVWFEGRFYHWQEHLARTPDGAYRWLVESDGHFLLAEPRLPSAFPITGGGVKVDGERARAFTHGNAVVDTVLGEFYWQVRTDDQVEARDYVHPRSGRMVSVETTPFEMAASLGHHLERREVEAAFPGVTLPKQRGVGAIQPNPNHPPAVWRAFAAAAVALFVLAFLLRARAANEVVHAATYGPAPAVVDQELVQFSEPFVVAQDRANLRIALSAPQVNQGYLDLLGALVNEETGEVTTFATAAQYYSGVSGGESWREGNRRGSVLLGRVPAGTYRLRLAARAYDQATGIPFSITVKSQVPRMLWMTLALLLLLVYPIVVTLFAAAFESRRWANSDFT